MEITNSNNYLTKISDLPNEIVSKYSILIKEYIELFQKNVNFSNKEYLKNIFLKGLTTINNVFNLLLLYTKNLELTFIYSQKSIFLYIEFIDQISEDANSFLQLNSQDAILFVYKKTIYEINNDYRKDLIITCEKEINLLFIIKQFTILYQNIIIYYLNMNIELKEIEKYITKIIKRNNLIKLEKNYLVNLNEILNLLALKNVSPSKFNYFIIHILKKNKIDKQDIETRIELPVFNENNNNLTSIKFSQWLIGK
tara:strand:+ start:1963 stop:2724 length:762 start_codon:yes stop_codon:yes gene_type:complete